MRETSWIVLERAWVKTARQRVGKRGAGRKYEVEYDVRGLEVDGSWVEVDAGVGVGGRMANKILEQHLVHQGLPWALLILVP